MRRFSPKPKRKTRSCGKRRFRDHNEATAALRAIKPGARGDQPVPVRAYACPYCGGFHLTSKEQA